MDVSFSSKARKSKSRLYDEKMPLAANEYTHLFEILECKSRARDISAASNITTNDIADVPVFHTRVAQDSLESLYSA